MKIRTWIYIGFLIVLIMFTIVTAVNINLSDKINSDVHWLSETEDVMKNSALLQKAVVDMETGLRGYLMSDNEEFLEPYYDAVVDYRIIRKKQDSLLSENSSKLTELELVDKKLDNWKTRFSEPLMNAKKRSVASPEEKKKYDELFLQTAKKGVGKNITDEIRIHFDLFDTGLLKEKVIRKAEMIDASRQADNITLSLNVVAIVVAFITALFIAWVIGTRIKDMVNLSETISSGDFNVNIREGRKDELERLRTSLNIMALRLKDNFHDIERVNRELRLSKIEVEKNANIKEQFFANMSHEIRTPLNAIIGFSEQLWHTRLSEKQRKYLLAIRSSGNSLIGLINDILDISKLNAGKIRLEKVTFSLSRQITSVIELFSLVAREKGISLKYAIENSPADLLVGDPARLNQILINLVGNAVKFTQQGRVELLVVNAIDEKDHLWIDFSVSDTGMGIRDEDLPGIFESYIQGSIDISRKYGGTGLGLTIVKNLLEMHGSIINAKSIYGKGSVFSFRLKYKKAEENDRIAYSEITEEEIIPEITGIRVLVIEDNDLNQMLVEVILEKWGWKISLAGSGAKAIEMMARNSYDLVLLDIRLPDISGYEIIKHIRNKLQGKNIDTPVIAMTAHSFESDGEKCFSYGMDEFITKPFNEKDLYRKAITVLRHRKPEQTKEKQSLVAMENDGKPNSHVEETPKFDLSYIRKMSGNDKNYIAKMINDFIGQAVEAVEIFKKSNRADDRERLKAVVHSMKSSYMIMGIEKAVGIIENIEDFENAGAPFDDLKNLVEALIIITEKAAQQLKKELDNL